MEGESSKSKATEAEEKATYERERREAEERQRKALERQRLSEQAERERAAAHAAYLLSELHAKDLARNGGEYDWNQDT